MRLKTYPALEKGMKGDNQGSVVIPEDFKKVISHRNPPFDDL